MKFAPDPKIEQGAQPIDCSVRLDVGRLMSPGIFFKAGVGVTKLNDLLKITRQEGGNRSSLLILVHVAELVTEQARSLMSSANKDGVSESEADHSGAQEPGL